MESLQMKIDAILHLKVTSEVERTAAMEDIRRLLDSSVSPVIVATADPESIIRQILFDLGAPDNLVGYPIAIEAVMIVLDEPRFMKRRICDLYEELGTCFDMTPGFVEKSLRYLIDRTWMLGNIDKQEEYFGYTVDFNKGKPTNSQFIARMANITRQRMKMA